MDQKKKKKNLLTVICASCTGNITEYCFPVCSLHLFTVVISPVNVFVQKTSSRSQMALYTGQVTRLGGLVGELRGISRLKSRRDMETEGILVWSRGYQVQIEEGLYFMLIN